MATTAVIPSRELRNHTADVLRRVEAGEEIEILHNNRPVAKLVPVRTRRQWIPAAEILTRVSALGPDRTGMADELRDTLGAQRLVLSRLRTHVRLASAPAVG